MAGDAAVQKTVLILGYEGISINSLTAVPAVTPPSIYAAFGDKNQLFREALQLYSGAGKGATQIIDDAPTARAVADKLLRAAAYRFTGTETPSGCLLASSAITGSAQSAGVQAELAAIRRGVEEHLRQRIEKAVTIDEMPSSVDAGTLAGPAMAVIHGICEGRGDAGAPAGAWQCGMAGWPTKPYIGFRTILFDITVGSDATMHGYRPKSRTMFCDRTVFDVLSRYG